MSLKSTTHAVLLATLVLPGVALAQAVPPTSGAPGAAPPVVAPASPEASHAAPPVRHRPGPSDNAARVEQRIKMLHSQLGITPAEQPQWDQFAAVMRDNARAMDQKLNERGTQFGSMSAVQDMQSYADLSAQHAQDMQKLAAAFQSLYAAMPDEQKQVADNVFRGRLARATHAKSTPHHAPPGGSSSG